MHLIIPIAGEGRRFKEAGYQEPKPFITIMGRRMIAWALDPIPPDWTIWIPCQWDRQRYVMEYYWGRKGHIIPIAGPTQGAACTVLAAAVGLPANDPVAVMNPDQVFSCDTEKLHTEAIEKKWDGYILTFPGTGPAWSYAVTNGTDKVVWVVEKKPVSLYATCGFYWWRRAGDLVRSICAMVASGQRTNNEFYLAPSYNFLPLADKDVRVVPVENFHGLGTPEDVKIFEAFVRKGLQ